MKSRFAVSLVWKIEEEKAKKFYNDTHFLFYTCNILILCIFQGFRRMPASLSISIAPLSVTPTTWVTLTTMTFWTRWMHTNSVTGWMWVSSSSSIFKGGVVKTIKLESTIEISSTLIEQLMSSPLFSLC
jgi:hypothetical protein